MYRQNIIVTIVQCPNLVQNIAKYTVDISNARSKTVFCRYTVRRIIGRIIRFPNNIYKYQTVT